MTRGAILKLNHLSYEHFASLTFHDAWEYAFSVALSLHTMRPFRNVLYLNVLNVPRVLINHSFNSASVMSYYVLYIALLWVIHITRECSTSIFDDPVHLLRQWGKFEELAHRIYHLASLVSEAPLIISSASLIC